VTEILINLRRISGYSPGFSDISGGGSIFFFFPLRGLFSPLRGILYYFPEGNSSPQS
jgi:hypothetical protein